MPIESVPITGNKCKSRFLENKQKSIATSMATMKMNILKDGKLLLKRRENDKGMDEESPNDLKNDTEDDEEYIDEKSQKDDKTNIYNLK